MVPAQALPRLGVELLEVESDSAQRLMEVRSQRGGGGGRGCTAIGPGSVCASAEERGAGVHRGLTHVALVDGGSGSKGGARGWSAVIDLGFAVQRVAGHDGVRLRRAGTCGVRPAASCCVFARVQLHRVKQQEFQVLMGERNELTSEVESLKTKVRLLEEQVRGTAGGGGRASCDGFFSNGSQRGGARLTLVDAACDVVRFACCLTLLVGTPAFVTPHIYITRTGTTCGTQPFPVDVADPLPPPPPSSSQRSLFAAGCGVPGRQRHCAGQPSTVRRGYGGRGGQVAGQAGGHRVALV